MLGPGAGLTADVVGDIFGATKMATKGKDVGEIAERGLRTPARLIRTPTAGPNVQQIIDWLTEEESAPVGPVDSRSTRGGTQRPILRR